MSATELLQPILRDGVRSVNFFNGRLLSAEDLSAEQNANREARRRLGQAVGDGVAYGLEVAESQASTNAAPAVVVSAGLAVNRLGQTLKLSAQTEISLIRQSTAETTAQAGQVFRDCQQLQAGVYVAGAGVYLLTVAPAEGREGRVPVSGLGNTTATCNTRYTVEGVQFRLLQLSLPASDLTDPARLRNRVAYRCFGTGPTLGSLAAGAQLASPSIVDALRPNSLTDCDVPLALVYWTVKGGVEFVDLWSVRRRLTQRSPSERWSLFVGDRRRSEVEAMILQFADHIQDIFAERTGPEKTNLEAVAAVDRFHFLPPFGLLPVAEQSSPGVPGFNLSKFFGAKYLGPIAPQVTVGQLRMLTQTALNYEPVDLSSADRFRASRISPNLYYFVRQTIIL